MEKKTKKLGLKKIKGKKKIIIPIIIAIVLLVLGVSFFMHGKKVTADAETQSTVSSAVAEKGNISTTVTGTGSLANGDTEDITIPVGVKVKKVLVESGDTVKKGQTLCTLDKASIAGELLDIRDEIDDVEDEIDDIDGDTSDETSDAYLEYLSLKGDLKTLEKTEDVLEDLLDSPKIKATSAGTIASVNVSDDTEVSQQTSSSSASSTGASASAISYQEDSDDELTFLSCITKKYTLSNMATEDETETAVSDGDLSLSVTAPETGKTPQDSISSADSYSATISWDPSDETFAAETVYTAKIVLTAKSGYYFDASNAPTVSGASSVSWEITESDSGDYVMTIKAAFDATAAADDEDSDDTKNDDEQKQDSEEEKANTSKNGTSDKTETKSDTGTSKQSSASGSAGTSGISISSSSGSGSSSASASSDSSSSGSSYDAYNATAFSIASKDKVTVSINVDELDINSVSEGQTAKVTLDAIEDQEFEGTITSVSGTAVSGTSSTKYPVEVTIDKTDEMKIGMSASVVIYMEEVEDAVVIPVSALQEQGNRTFVYTSEDEDGNLSGEVDVETGLSNGTQVEITSGLEDGDTVYYLKTTSDSSDDMSVFDMGGGQDMGDMPDMGNMPDNGGGDKSGSSEWSGGPSGGGMPGQGSSK